MLVSERHPPRGKKSVVIRNGSIFTAIPCYGMHEPWWVVRLMPDTWPNEAEPVPMRDDDKWFPLSSFDDAINQLDAHELAESD